MNDNGTIQINGFNWQTRKPLKIYKKKNSNIWIEKVNEHEWKFEYSQKRWNIDTEFDRAQDLMEDGKTKQAEAIFRNIIKKVPEHIDIYHHLAIILDKTRRKKSARRLWEKAVQIGMDCIPQEFVIGRDLLNWSRVENRPFLRAYEGLAINHFNNEEIEPALKIFTDLLQLNQNDNQGCRELAIECYFRLNNPEGVLSICNRYKKDWLAGVMYGEVLALFQLGRIDEAKKALSNAVKERPLIAKELTKKSHRWSEGLSAYGIAVNSPDEAYDYWMSNKDFWENSPGAIKFVEENM